MMLTVAFLALPMSTFTGDPAYASLMMRADARIEEPVPDVRAWPLMQLSFRFAAVRWQLYDLNELSYKFTNREAFPEDISELRARFEELKDAPPLEDADRIPNRDYLHQKIQFNRRLRKNLDEARDLYPHRAAMFEKVMSECDEIYRVWDLARDASQTFYYVPHRRRCLMQLKKALGDEAYATMDLPWFVPNWRFPDLVTPGGP